MQINFLLRNDFLVHSSRHPRHKRFQMASVSEKHKAQIFLPQLTSDDVWKFNECSRIEKKYETGYTSLCHHVNKYHSSPIVERLSQKQATNAKFSRLIHT